MKDKNLLKLLIGLLILLAFSTVGLLILQITSFCNFFLIPELITYVIIAAVFLLFGILALYHKIVFKNVTKKKILKELEEESKKIDEVRGKFNL